MEAATVWKWVRRVFRYYVYFICVIWLASALMLLYLMHSPAASLSSSHLAHPASHSAAGPHSSGPYRLHELMLASTATLHTNLRVVLNNTRATADTLLRPPSPLHALTSPIADAVEEVVSVLEAVVDGVCAVMRELADEWLVQTVEMMEELRERQNNPNTATPRSLPWQQQQLDVKADGRTGAAATGQQQQQQHGRQSHHNRQQVAAAAESGRPAAGASAAAAASGQRHANPARPSRPANAQRGGPSSITAPIESTQRSVLPDGSALLLSPLASDDAAFSLQSVADMSGGAEGEQRVALSLKDGLLRVTRKGQRGDIEELIRQLHGEHEVEASASAA